MSNAFNFNFDNCIKENKKYYYNYYICYSIYKMNRIFPYIFIIILLLLSLSYLQKLNKEYYDNNYLINRPPGPWGQIGTGEPWYKYPYILHNIEYY